MNVATTFEADTKTAEMMQPGMCTLDDPTVLSQTTAVFSAALGEHRLDAAFAQFLPMPLGIVASIGIDGFRFLQRASAHSSDRRNGIDQRQQLRDVIAVCAGQDRRDRDAIGVRGDVVLGTWSRAIGGVPACFSPAPTARMDDESTTTREKSIRSAARNLASSSSCNFSQTPASCQSRKRLQQVTPEPQPISAGRSRQRMPVLSTKTMPVSAARSDTGLRPGYFHRLGLGAGSSGSISAHSSSLTIGLPISLAPSVKTRKVNRMPRKLTAPRGL